MTGRTLEVQNSSLDGIVIGGGILYRFPEVGEEAPDVDPLAEEWEEVEEDGGREERGAGAQERELAGCFCSRVTCRGPLLLFNPGVAEAGKMGVRLGLSDRERRRRIISAETRHRGDDDKEGSAGDGGPLLLVLVLLLLSLVELLESVRLSLEGSLLLDREGREKERERRLPRGSGSVSVSISMDLDIVSKVLSSDALEAWKRDQARRSSHLRTSLPRVSKTESSRIRSYSFLRLCRSCALAERARVR